MTKPKKIVYLSCNPATLARDLKILEEKGYKVYNISDFTTFDDFKHMADACLNIVCGPIALKAAEQMKDELDIPFLKAFVNYDPDEIERFYKELSEVLGEDFVTPSNTYRKKALDKIQQANSIIGNYPIAIDYQAVLKPYTLGSMLAKHGFHTGNFHN